MNLESLAATVLGMSKHDSGVMLHTYEGALMLSVFVCGSQVDVPVTVDNISEKLNIAIGLVAPYYTPTCEESNESVLRGLSDLARDLTDQNPCSCCCGDLGVADEDTLAEAEYALEDLITDNAMEVAEGALDDLVLDHDLGMGEFALKELTALANAQVKLDIAANPNVALADLKLDALTSAANQTARTSIDDLIRQAREQAGLTD